jgi:hypothetical protein
VCEEEPYLLELVRYLHLNPLRAGIIKNIEQLHRYAYTGHSALTGKVSRPWQETEEALSFFGRTVSEARKRYTVFVSEGIAQGKRPDLAGGGLLRRGREAYRSDERVLGSSSFVESILKEAEALAPHSLAQVTIAELKQRIAGYLGVSLSVLSGGSRAADVSRARALLCYVWTRHLGRSGRELSRELGVSPQAVYSAAARIAEEGGVDPELLKIRCGQETGVS